MLIVTGGGGGGVQTPPDIDHCTILYVGCDVNFMCINKRGESLGINIKVEPHPTFILVRSLSYIVSILFMHINIMG